MSSNTKKAFALWMEGKKNESITLLLGIRNPAQLARVVALFEGAMAR